MHVAVNINLCMRVCNSRRMGASHEVEPVASVSELKRLTVDYIFKVDTCQRGPPKGRFPSGALVRLAQDRSSGTRKVLLSFSA